MGPRFEVPATPPRGEPEPEPGGSAENPGESIGEATAGPSAGVYPPMPISVRTRFTVRRMPTGEA
jgi:hypothetical protein